MGVVAALFLCCCPSRPALSAGEQKAAGAKGPRIKFDRAEPDFGKGLAGPVYSTEFHFRNVGDDILIIDRTRTTCGCTGGITSMTRLAPGGKGVLKVNFNSFGREGLQTGSVYIYSNDPENPASRVRYKIELTGTVKVSDDDLHCGVFHRGEVRSRTFTVQFTGEEAFSIERIETSASYVRARYEKMKEWDKKGYAVHAEIAADAPLGDFAERVDVYTNITKDRPVSVKLIGRVLSHVEIVPVAVRLRSRVRTRSATVRKTHGGPFRITGSNSTLPYVSIRVQTNTKGREYRITVGLRPSAPKGRHEGRIILETDMPEEPKISIPVYVSIR